MGKFITFEGIEGSGKTTQIEMLRDYLLQKNHRVTITREPGGTLIGDQIRKILLHDKNNTISDETELLLYEACRAQHIQEIIMPALKENRIVLCDRFSDSTLAYQGYGRRMNGERIEKLNKMVAGKIEPDLTILLDMDVSLGLSRAKKRNASVREEEREERFEKETLEFHQRVRNGFLELAQKNKKRIKVIDANRDVDDIQGEIKNHVDKVLGSGGA